MVVGRDGKITIKSVNNPIYVGGGVRKTPIITQRKKYYEFLNILGEWYLTIEKQF